MRNPPDVRFGVFAAGAGSDVDGKLKHGETFLEQVLAELMGGFALGIGSGGQVEEYDDPHKAVGAEAFGVRGWVSHVRR